MKKKKKSGLASLFVMILLLILAVTSFTSQPDELKTVKRSSKVFDGNFPLEYKIVSPKLPKNIKFCGETVPLKNIDVRERLDREIIVNTYWHSLSILSMKRVKRWFPIIEPILKKYKVPDDLKYLALSESMLTNVISPAGATGFWQFKKETAREYGLEVNREIDERYNVRKATEAACKFLLDSYKKYKNWTLAAASFNYGRYALEDQMSKQETNNYYNLVLPEETSRYVFRILAIKEVMEHPKRYGFYLKNDDYYPPYKTYKVKIKGNIKSWAQFARKKGINYKILKMLNPWLRKNYLNNKKHKTYFVDLPVEGSIYVIPERESE